MTDHGQTPTRPLTAAELAQAVRKAQADLAGLDRILGVLAESYDLLPDDDLGIADRAAVVEIIDSISDVRLALGEASDPIASAVWNADRLVAGPPHGGHRPGDSARFSQD